MKDIEEIKSFVRTALVSVNNNIQYGTPLIHDARFARFWEGRMVENGQHKHDLETILDMLSED